RKESIDENRFPGEGRCNNRGYRSPGRGCCTNPCRSWSTLLSPNALCDSARAVSQPQSFQYRSPVWNRLDRSGLRGCLLPAIYEALGFDPLRGWIHYGPHRGDFLGYFGGPDEYKFQDLLSLLSCCRSSATPEGG